jgi:hypothetical protein
MDNRIIYLIAFVLGLIFWAWLYHAFLKPESETIIEYKETIVTRIDSIPYKEIVYVDRWKIKHEYLRDTILIDYEPKINEFKATFPLMYGNAYLSGEVLGEVLKTSLTTDFKIPQVTNTITKEKNTTIIKKPTGIYAVGGISSNFQYSIGANYLRDKSMFGYRYQPQVKIHSLEVGFKVF